MMTSFWSFDLSWQTVTAALVFLVISLILSIRYVRRFSDEKRIRNVELLRIPILIAIILTLLRPELVRVAEKTERPLVAVLCDASGSMATHDVVDTNGTAVVRREWIDKQLKDEFWKPLADKYDVTIDSFSGTTNQPATDETAGVTSDPGTDLNLALESVLEQRVNLRAVVLLSDGDWNAGKSPVSAATALRLRGVPVYACSVGSDSYLPDLELKEILAPAYGLVEEHISLPFTVQSRLPRDVKTSVTLMGPQGTLAYKDIVIPQMAEYQDTILLTPRKAGEYEFTLRMPVERDEFFEDNNRKNFHISLRRELLKVLIVETRPRWEYRFLKNALSRDPGVDVKVLLLHPGMDRAEGKDYLAAFPETRDALSTYDVIFLGDVGIGPDGLSSKHADLIEGLVKRQGSGLVFLPGVLGRQMTMLDSKLGDLMPVIMDRKMAGGFGFELESRLDLTSRGRGHLLTMLGNTSSQNARIWASLPGFFWHAPATKAKPGTDVLAVHSTARGQFGRVPLLVTRTYGTGKVLFMGTDAAWRWRRGVEDTYHYRFWGQVVRWMAHQRHLAHDAGIRFFYTPEAPNAGDRVFLHATVFDKSGYPLKEGHAKAVISADNGFRYTLDLAKEDGGWGVFSGSFIAEEAGQYEIKVRCPETGKETFVETAVKGIQRERIGQPAKTGILREICAITQGRFGETGDLDDMISGIKLLPDQEPQQERLRIWCHPLWLAMLISLFCLYWISRKLAGLI